MVVEKEQEIWGIERSFSFWNRKKNVEESEPKWIYYFWYLGKKIDNLCHKYSKIQESNLLKEIDEIFFQEFGKYYGQSHLKKMAKFGSRFSTDRILPTGFALTWKEICELNYFKYYLLCALSNRKEPISFDLLEEIDAWIFREI